MTTIAISPDQLRRALEKTGYDWLLRYWGEESQKHLEKATSALAKFSREYHRRFKERPDVFGLVDANPVKAAAFFQPDTLLASPEMKIMVWRILLGCEIGMIEFHYEAGQTSRLRIDLVSPYGVDETYSTDNASDFRLLRHIGITGVGGEWELQGYYALARPH